jgi:hypothetical protein
MGKPIRIVLALLLLGVFACNNDDNNNPTTSTQPTITGMSPASVKPGQQNVAGTINGTNFNGSPTVNLGAGITVAQASLVNANQINVKFSVNNVAPDGAHTISVTVSGGTASADNLFSVNPKKPAARFAVTPETGDLNTVFRFDASSSDADGAGKIDSYRWNFGDGKQDQGKVVQHKFTKPNSFGVELTVKSNYGEQDSNKKNVKVNDVGGGGGGGGVGGCSQEPETMAPESTACSGYGNAQYFRIAKVEAGGTYLTSDHEMHLCRGHVCEVRKLHVEGYAEFLGDVKGLDCNNRRMRMDHSHQPAYFEPHVGDRALMVCK